MTNSFRFRAASREQTIAALLRIGDLPYAPSTIEALDRERRRPALDAEAVTAATSSDPALLAKILWAANRPDRGAPREAATASHAAALLGADELERIASAISLAAPFLPVEERLVDVVRFRRSSVLTALLSRRIAEDLGRRRSGEAYAAGLLADVGALLVAGVFPEAGVEALESGDAPERAERDRLGATSAEIAAFLLNLWNLPSSLVETTLLRDRPGDATTDPELTAIVHMATVVARSVGETGYALERDLDLDASIVDTLRLGGERYLHDLTRSYRDLALGADAA
ncbi:MAG: HDOD domain-containing protein [Ignavibacteriales bacterium]|jgi:HD-like signal output (HDOD) protein|nr:HDOD domain-containing protein [Ignavibacteriales bacterium]